MKMKNKLVYTNSNGNVFDLLNKGASKLEDIVSSTLGPGGRNVLIEDDTPIITKDGVTVAKSIQFKDPSENLGAQIIKQAASQTAEVAGDGTTTATVLAYKIISAGLKYVAAGANPIELKRGIDSAVKDAINIIKTNAKNIENNEQILSVAKVSANNDEKIGTLVSEAFAEIGKDGSITVEDSQTSETFLEIVEGAQYDRGYLSPYFINDQVNMKTELRNPYIFITEDKLSTVKQVVPILERILQQAEQPASLLIIADNIEGEALATLIVNKVRGNINLAATRAPEFGDRRLEYLKDLAILTGATIFSSKTGTPIKDVTLEKFGRARMAVISNKKTVIIDGKGEDEKIQARISEVKQQIESAESDYDKEKIKERLSKISGGVAIINVGAETELELKEKKYRLEDAISATKAAIAMGVVPGSGSMLAYVKHKLIAARANNDFEMGYNLLVDSLDEPFRKIIINHFGTDKSSVIWEKIVSNINPENKFEYGYNIRTESVENMHESGIIDPALVAKTVIEKSASVAGLFLTTGGIICNDPDEKEVSQIMPMEYGDQY